MSGAGEIRVGTARGINRTNLIFARLLLVLLLAALPVLAQERTVTDDEVNAVARQLYCPVCENIPLDACGTPACIQWRGEIRAQLEQGQTPDAIVANFVRLFGERVVGTPRDPALRAVSVITPWVMALAALVVAARILLRRHVAAATQSSAVGGHATQGDDDYRARLEADLRARR